MGSTVVATAKALGIRVGRTDELCYNDVVSELATSCLSRLREKYRDVACVAWAAPFGAVSSFPAPTCPPGDRDSIECCILTGKRCPADPSPQEQRLLGNKTEQPPVSRGIKPPSPVSVVDQYLRDVLVESQRLCPRLQAVVNKIKSGPPFVALHVRRSEDLRGKAEDLRGNTGLHTYALPNEVCAGMSRQGLYCYSAACLRSIIDTTKVSRVFLASASFGRDKAIGSRFLAEMGLQVIQLPQLDPQETSLVEQAVAGEAEVFIGTAGSTWTSLVQFGRQARGKASLTLSWLTCRRRPASRRAGANEGRPVRTKMNITPGR